MFSDTEIKHVDDIIKRMSRYISKTYSKGNTKRDAHPKTIAIIKGEFTVLENLPKTLKKGLFTSPKTYKTIIRFSNGNSKIQSDTKKDVRGIALKLIDIETDIGRDCRSKETRTQDFLLMSNPTMPLGTIKKFRDAIIYTLDTTKLKSLIWLLLNVKIFFKLLNTKKKHQSISNIEYWSCAPFQFENQIVKYKLIPTVGVSQKYAIDSSYNFLRNRLISLLKKEAIYYDFCIQFFKNDETTPLNDLSKEWNEKNSPFFKIARLKIPKQQVKEQDILSNKIVFSIVNSYSIHKATGKLNEARIKIYNCLSDLRKHRNDQSNFEPTIEDYNKL